MGTFSKELPSEGKRKGRYEGKGKGKGSVGSMDWDQSTQWSGGPWDSQPETEEMNLGESHNHDKWINAVTRYNGWMKPPARRWGNPIQRDDSTPKWMMQWPSIGSVGFVGFIDKDRSEGKEVNWIDKKDGIKKNGWRRINFQIDSGALDTVTPKDTPPGEKCTRHLRPTMGLATSQPTARRSKTAGNN